MLDDKTIMLEVQAGRFELFDQLVLRYRDPLIRVAASKLGDVAWAEDIVQETFLAVFASRQTYNPQFAFRTWLWTILLNLCRRQLKRKKNRPQEVSDSTLELAVQFPLANLISHESGLSRVLLKERAEQLEKLLDELTEVQADAIRLRFFGELKYDEIAQAMGCSLGGAKLRVKNGLAAMAERLRSEEEELL